MARSLITLFLVFTFALGVQAQGRNRWASARQRGLKGQVRTVTEECSGRGNNFRYGYKYEFTRDGKLMVITSLQPERPVFKVSGGSWKHVRRNARGDATEGAFFLMGQLEHRERWEYEYDGGGNWTKAVRYMMREYEVEGGDWPAGEWRAILVCNRTIEYYP